MHVCFSKSAYNHHGIVTNVMPAKNTYEIIHMTGDKDTLTDKTVFGLAEIKKEIKHFDDDKISYYYKYNEYSMEEIYRNIPNETSEENMVLKRAYLLYEAFEIFRFDVYYKLLKFNCEHFASYCSTGLAFCKQQEVIMLTTNLPATTLLDKL